MTEITKDRIKNIVRDYEALHTAEFLAYKEQRFVEKGKLANEYAARKGDVAVMRELFSIPETLSHMLKSRLTDEEWDHIWGGNDPACNGAIWFARTFAQYRTGTRI